MYVCMYVCTGRPPDDDENLMSENIGRQSLLMPAGSRHPWRDRVQRIQGSFAKSTKLVRDSPMPLPRGSRTGA